MYRVRSRKGGMTRRQIDLQAQALAGLVEAGLLMACADGHLADEEVDVVANVIDGFFDGQVTVAQIRSIMNSCLQALERDGFEARLDALAVNLQSRELCELALAAAAAVMLSDGEYVEGQEDEIYYDMAASMDVPEDRAASILDEVASMYG